MKNPRLTGWPLCSIHDIVTELKSCTMEKDIRRGRALYATVVQNGEDSNMYVVTTLINMYAKCGSIVDARSLFDRIKNPNVVTWTALISGYAENGEGYMALELFTRMKDSGCTPNTFTYVAVVKACTSLADGSERIQRVKEIHSEIGYHSNHYVRNTLIDMYSKCGCMEEAHSVFKSIQEPNLVSWNALLMGYAQNGNGHVALDLFSTMKARGCAPSSFTYVAVLKACTSLCVYGVDKHKYLQLGREIHADIGCELSYYVQSALIDMYSKCSSMFEARQVFESIDKPDVVSWNALLLGYVENGQGLAALELFYRMRESACVPDSLSYVAALKACTALATTGNTKDSLELGRKIHSEIGSNLKHNVENTLIDMYGKCGSVAEARIVFESMKKPDVVSWNALLLGYADNGEPLAALDLFSKMKALGCDPDSVTYLAALKACGLVGALSLGQTFHSEIRHFTTTITTCLVDFYAKCGSMEKSCEVFDTHQRNRDVTTWTALLAGYARFGDTHAAFKLFEVMKDEGLKPDGVSFVCLLLCCSHAGLVEKAREYFQAMPVQYHINPSLVHYNCMVDVLGRANQLSEAIGMIRRMPCSPDGVTWMTLLGACRKWKNMEIGREAFLALRDINNTKTSAYTVMSNIYRTRTATVNC